jgi:hypothetical protein
VKTAAPLAPKESDAPIVTNPTPILFRETVVTTEKEVSKPSSSIVSVEFRHDGSFSGRSWEKLYIRLLDADGNTVENPVIQKDYVLRTAYGEAEFRPALLSELDFVKGVAEVNMLPRGRRTVVVKLIPFNQFSQPLRYERTR